MISRLAHFAANFFASLAAMTLAFPALALTQDELITQCKEAARAPVVACMAKAGARLDLCIASVGRPFVYACVVRLEQQQAARVPPPLPPKDEAASATKNEKSVRNAFVAPPRTIADITAILDSEKPDDAKIGKLVYDRFVAEKVQHFYEMKSYRPKNLSKHEKLEEYYEDQTVN
jgi:hypothetical protein